MKKSFILWISNIVFAIIIYNVIVYHLDVIKNYFYSLKTLYIDFINCLFHPVTLITSSTLLIVYLLYKHRDYIYCSPKKEDTANILNKLPTLKTWSYAEKVNKKYEYLNNLPNKQKLNEAYTKNYTSDFNNIYILTLYKKLNYISQYLHSEFYFKNDFLISLYEQISQIKSIEELNNSNLLNAENFKNFVPHCFILENNIIHSSLRNEQSKFYSNIILPYKENAAYHHIKSFLNANNPLKTDLVQMVIMNEKYLHHDYSLSEYAITKVKLNPIQMENFKNLNEEMLYLSTFIRNSYLRQLFLNLLSQDLNYLYLIVFLSKYCSSNNLFNDKLINQYYKKYNIEDLMEKHNIKEYVNKKFNNIEILLLKVIISLNIDGLIHTSQVRTVEEQIETFILSLKVYINESKDNIETLNKLMHRIQATYGCYDSYNQKNILNSNNLHNLIDTAKDLNCVKTVKFIEEFLNANQANR